MKKAFQYISILLFGAVLLSSCEKDENPVYYEGGTAPALTANRSASIPLTFLGQSNEAITLNWTNPNYKFTTGLSSQDVTYLIEFDTTGANFTNPKKATVSVSKDLSKTFTQSEINDILLNSLELKKEVPHNIEVRVKSALINNNAILISNVLKFVVIPYAIPPKVLPPSSGKLFITGGATPGNWQCGCGEAELASQRFTQISPTLYELASINLNAGGSYLFLPVYGSWANKYGYTGAGNANDPLSDDFKDGGNDIKAPAVGGLYKIQVDFQRGKFTLTKL